MRFLVVKRRTIVAIALAAVLIALAVTGVYYTGAATIYNNVSPKKVPIYSVEVRNNRSFSGSIFLSSPI